MRKGTTQKTENQPEVRALPEENIKRCRDSIARSYRRSECVEGPYAQWYEFGND